MPGIQETHRVNFTKLQELAVQVDYGITAIQIDEEMNENSLQTLVKALDRNKQINAVTIKLDGGLAKPYGSLLTLLRKNKTVTSLHLQLTSDFARPDLFSEAILTNTSLQALSLEVPQDSTIKLGDSVWKIFTKLHKRQRPIRLRLNNGLGVAKGYYTTGFAQHFRDMPLTSLSLVNCSLHDSEAKTYFFHLRRSTTLKILDVSRNFIPDNAGLETLIAKEEECEPLEELHCGFNQLTDITAKRIAEELKVNPPLKVLSINNNPMTSEGLSHIFKRLRYIVNLQLLDVRGIEVTNDALQVLIQSLYTNTTLTKVDFDSNQNLQPDLITKVEQLLSRNRGEPQQAVAPDPLPQNIASATDANEAPETPPAKRAKLFLEDLLNTPVEPSEPNPSAAPKFKSIADLLDLPAEPKPMSIQFLCE